MEAPQREWEPKSAFEKADNQSAAWILNSNTETCFKIFRIFQFHHHLWLMEQFTESLAAS
jgi:hypothetical protein